LLKVDVERAELQVLQGVQQQHWLHIQQLALEVRAAMQRLHYIAQAAC
jgi:FkbM family methyltransferase